MGYSPHTDCILLACAYGPGRMRSSRTGSALPSSFRSGDNLNTHAPSAGYDFLPDPMTVEGMKLFAELGL